MATRRSQEELDAISAQWEREYQEQKAIPSKIWDTEKYFQNPSGEWVAWETVHAAKKGKRDRHEARLDTYNGLARDPRTGKPWKWGVPYASTDGPQYWETHLPGRLLVFDKRNDYTKEYKVEHDPVTGMYTKRTFVRYWGLLGQTAEEDEQFHAMFENLPKNSR